jgi:hypothetical protein
MLPIESFAHDSGRTLVRADYGVLHANVCILQNLLKLLVHFANGLGLQKKKKQLYRPPRPITEIALLYGDGVCFL